MVSKTTSGKIASTAGKTLGSSSASKIQKILAGSALAQSGTAKVTGQAMEGKASAALQSKTSNATTKALAGSIVSQSKK